MVRKNRQIPGPKKNKSVVKNTPMKKAARVLTALGRGAKSLGREAIAAGGAATRAGGEAWSGYSDWAREQNIKAAEHNLAMTELRMQKRQILEGSEAPELVEGGDTGWTGGRATGRFPLPDRRYVTGVDDMRDVSRTPVRYVEQPVYVRQTPPSPQAGQSINIVVGAQPQAQGAPPQREAIYIPPPEAQIPIGAEMGPEMGPEMGMEPTYVTAPAEELGFQQSYQRPRPTIRREPIMRFRPTDRTGILGTTGILQTRTFLGSTGALASRERAVGIGTGRLLLSTGMLRATGAYQSRTYRPPRVIGVQSLGPIMAPQEEAQQPPQQPPAKPQPKRKPGQVPNRGMRR